MVGVPSRQERVSRLWQSRQVRAALYRATRLALAFLAARNLMIGCGSQDAKAPTRDVVSQPRGRACLVQLDWLRLFLIVACWFLCSAAFRVACKSQLASAVFRYCTCPAELSGHMYSSTSYFTRAHLFVVARQHHNSDLILLSSTLFEYRLTRWT